jgi:hypothetical protein
LPSCRLSWPEDEIIDLRSFPAAGFLSAGLQNSCLKAALMIYFVKYRAYKW